MSQPFQIPQPGQHLWIDAKLIVVDAAVSPEAAAELLPPPLVPAEPATATFYISDFPETRFGSSYREAAVILHARDEQGPAMSCPWMVVDEDTALILGRELLGFPKKMAEISFDETGDRVVAVVSRRGEEVMRIEAELGEEETDPAPILNKRTINVHGSIVGGMKLIELNTAEDIKSSRTATAKLRLGKTDRDPLADLDADPTGPARFVTMDFGAGELFPKVIGDVEPSWALRKFFSRAM